MADITIGNFNFGDSSFVTTYVTIGYGELSLD